METLVRPAPPKDLPRWPESFLIRLDALCDALTFPTPTSFRFADDPIIEVEGPTDRPLPDRLVEALWPVIYERIYARINSPEGLLRNASVNSPDPEFLARLSAAHASRTHWNPAWRVEWLGNDGSIRVWKGETLRTVQPGQYTFGADPNRPPRPGEFVDLLVLRESFVTQPGFYYAYGETLGCENDTGRIARIYVHATADGIPKILNALSTKLNRYEVPFLFKCREEPAHFDRADAAVLFVATRYSTIVLRLLQEIDEILDPNLRPGTPLFTKELRPGLGLADNPGGFESFGQNRCILVARGLIDAHFAHQHGREARHRSIAFQFEQAGLDPARPHLNPRLTDPYRWPDESSGLAEPASSPSPSRQSETTPFLEAADRIGRRLCRDALWAGERCNWMTWTTGEVNGRPIPVHRAAPPGLANGVAGIALFLAQLQRLTGDHQQKIALGGAVRQLLATAPSLTDPGYERGRTGVGSSLISIGEACSDKGLIRRGIGFLQIEPGLIRSIGPLIDFTQFIICLIDVAHRHDHPELLDQARAHADSLFEREGVENSNRSPAELAALVLAFLELDRAIPEYGMRDAALEFLRRDPTVKGGLWKVDPRTIRGNTTLRTYLRILELLGEQPPITIDLEEILQLAVASLDGFQRLDLTFGQGLTGVADFLIQAAQTLDRPDLRQAVRRFGYGVLDRYDRPSMPWPCGIPNAGETPDMMLGLAGIGMTFLRMVNH